MADRTNIQWADSTWSPWRGCTKVSPGCANCYAEALSVRNPSVFGEWGKGASRVLAKNWGDPMRWNRHSFIGPNGEAFASAECTSTPTRRTRVFPSLCDWLDDEVSPAWLAQFLALVELTPNLDWLLLTKRPELWRDRLDAAALASTPYHQRWLVEWLKGIPPHNVWFGVSVEDQTRAQQRIPILMNIPARVRWLSVEPLIGPVDLSEWAHVSLQHHPDGSESSMRRPFDWVVVGGESGPRARRCDLQWIVDIIWECKDIPVFVKQLGSAPGFREGEARHLGKPDGKLIDPKGGDPSEWPAFMRVREFPEALA